MFYVSLSFLFIYKVSRHFFIYIFNEECNDNELYSLLNVPSYQLFNFLNNTSIKNFPFHALKILFLKTNFTYTPVWNCKYPKELDSLFSLTVLFNEIHIQTTFIFIANVILFQFDSNNYNLLAFYSATFMCNMFLNV